MNKKEFIICAVICGVAVLAFVGAVAYSIMADHTEPYHEDTQGQVEVTSEDASVDDETTGENTVPAIKEDPKLPDVQGTPNIDVEAMTRGSEAEVVDSKIEYGTKEAEGHEK